jgi:hypothetical protein
MGTTMKFKLPPRFKIFHNVSEDYFFIKERFCLFWYLSEKTPRYIQVAFFRHQKIKEFPRHAYQYATLEEAESKIQFILYNEKPQPPDEIKLVKELNG